VGAARAPLPDAGLVLTAPVWWIPINHPLIYTVGFTGLAVGYAAIIVASLDMPDVAPARALAAVDRRSYSIYL